MMLQYIYRGKCTLGKVATNIEVGKCSMSDGPINVFHILGSVKTMIDAARSTFSNPIDMVESW